MEKICIRVQSILYKNEKDSLLKAIRALANAVRVSEKNQAPVTGVELYYGDSSDDPIFSEEDVTAVNEQYGDYLKFTYHFFGFNSGSAKGHNTLAEDCRTSYIMIMNPDVIVSPRFFIEIMKPFEKEDVGMVEARQTPIEHQKEYDVETGETGWATTACAVIPFHLFQKLNGFDSDTFFLYCDDLDFSWRIRLLGYKIIYQPLAPVFHAKRLSVSGSWQPTDAEKYYSAEAALMMAYKWSNDERVEYLLNVYGESNDENLKKAVEHFYKMKEEKKLPEQIDKEHKVAEFIGDYYSENRFIL